MILFISVKKCAIMPPWKMPSKKVSQFLNGTNFLPTKRIKMKTMAAKTNKSFLLTLFDFLYCHSLFVPSILPNQ